MFLTKPILALLVISQFTCESPQTQKSCKDDAIALSKSEAGGMTDLKTELFSVSLPESLEKIPITNDDSLGWEYSDKTMNVSIEAGLYVASFGDHLSSYPEYCEESRIIDGEFVKVVSLDFGAEKNRGDLSKPYLVGVHFPQSNRVRVPISFSVSFRSKTDAEKAFRIIDSIKINR